GFLLNRRPILVGTCPSARNQLTHSLLPISLMYIRLIGNRECCLYDAVYRSRAGIAMASGGLGFRSSAISCPLWPASSRKVRASRSLRARFARYYLPGGRGHDR